RASVPSLLNRLRLDKFRNLQCVQVLAVIIENEGNSDVLSFLIREAQVPDSCALEWCAELLPGLGPDADVLLPYMLRDTKEGGVSKQVFWDTVQRMKLTERSLPELE